MPTDLTVANTIAQQIGGRAFVMMGTSFKTGDKNSLSFDVKGSKKVTHIRVALDPDDTYTVEFCKIRGTNRKDVGTFKEIYADGLRELISEQTGLLLSL